MASTEMQSPKNGTISINSLSETKDVRLDSETKVTHAYESAYPVDPTSMRRLFSFVQLLAFALTFMESWEVMAMSMCHNKSDAA